ncbi:8-oxo-dGTP diphosphatase [compost metagenome]
MIKWTICFIRRGNEFLLLNRAYEPGMGRWNGVGGKIEVGETPLESVIRETNEETGILLTNPKYTGQVTWFKNGEKTGMHCFIADVNDNYDYATPIEVKEGILSWKSSDWIFHSRNKGVLPHLQAFLPIMLEDSKTYEHLCTFENDVLVKHEVFELFEDDELQAVEGLYKY